MMSFGARNECLGPLRKARLLRFGPSISGDGALVAGQSALRLPDGSWPCGPSCGPIRCQYCGWTKSICHHLKNPGVLPLQIPNNGLLWLQSGAGLRPQFHTVFSTANPPQMVVPHSRVSYWLCPASGIEPALAVHPPGNTLMACRGLENSSCHAASSVKPQIFSSCWESSSRGRPVTRDVGMAPQPRTNPQSPATSTHNPNTKHRRPVSLRLKTQAPLKGHAASASPAKGRCCSPGKGVKRGGSGTAFRISPPGTVSEEVRGPATRCRAFMPTGPKRLEDMHATSAQKRKAGCSQSWSLFLGRCSYACRKALDCLEDAAALRVPEQKGAVQLPEPAPHPSVRAEH